MALDFGMIKSVFPQSIAAGDGFDENAQQRLSIEVGQGTLYRMTINDTTEYTHDGGSSGVYATFISKTFSIANPINFLLGLKWSAQIKNTTVGQAVRVQIKITDNVSGKTWESHLQIPVTTDYQATSQSYVAKGFRTLIDNDGGNSIIDTTGTFTVEIQMMYITNPPAMMKDNILDIYFLAGTTDNIPVVVT